KYFSSNTLMNLTNGRKNHPSEHVCAIEARAAIDISSSLYSIFEYTSSFLSRKSEKLADFIIFALRLTSKNVQLLQSPPLYFLLHFVQLDF
ncbi:hypothetical protein, partial [Streptococcus suis]